MTELPNTSPSAPHSPESEETSPPRLEWVPVRSLSATHRPRILGHLLALTPEDRYMRFGYAASDEHLQQYVEGLNFARDEIFGVFNWRLDLLAMAHLAYEGKSKDEPSPRAEFGVSVLQQARGRGYGRRLLDHAMLHARNRDVDTLLVNALSDNKAMLAIARQVGATVERSGPESQAVIKLPPDNLATHVEALVEDSAAELNYRIKRHSRQLDELMSGISEVKARFTRRSDAPADSG